MLELVVEFVPPVLVLDDEFELPPVVLLVSLELLFVELVVELLLPPPELVGLC